MRTLNQFLSESKGKKGLWDNVWAKRRRGEKPAKKGDPDYPDSKAWKNVQNESFIPPQAVADAAKRGLEAREKASPSDKGGFTVKQASKHGIGSGVQRAVNLKNRDALSLKTVKQMHSFFSRHEGNYRKARQRGEKPSESRAIQAWLLWGGDPGRTWAAKILRQEENKDEKS